MISIHRAFSFFRITGLLAGSLAFSVFAATPPLQNNDVDLSSTVTRGSLRGVLVPLHNLQLSSRSAGVIEKFGAEEGQAVAAGDLLVQLSADIERADIARAEAVLESTNGELERAKRELERSQKLRSDSIGSEKELEDAQYAQLLAITRRKQAEADLEMARARLNERSVFAPIAGLVFRRTRSIGEAVERLETVIRLVDATKLELIVYAGPELLGKFRKDQNVRIMVDTGPARGTTITGAVSYVDPTMDPESGAFRIKMEINPTETIQAGISVTLLVPSEVN